MSVEDADALGLSSGDRTRIVTAAGAAEATVEVNETMLAGHLSLPNGYGLDDDGVAANALTSLRWRDPRSGTPWHKHVPARLEPPA
jgi:anaerobic selenocysteine-containing dehydrogenase